MRYNSGNGNHSDAVEVAVCPFNTSCGDQGNHTPDVIHTSFETTPEAYIVPVVFILIFLVGVVGNGTLIFIVCRNKNMRNVPNIFIVSLAMGDLLLILVSVPFTATIYTFTEWPYGESACKLNEFLQSLSLGVSVFTLTALSADRFFAIVDPMKRHRTSSTAITLTIAGSIWGLAGGLALLELFAAHIKEKTLRAHDRLIVLDFCELFPQEWGSWYPKFHVIFRFMVYFLIPMVTIAVFYLLMAYILLMSAKRFPSDVDGKSSQQLKQIEARKKVAKLILSFVLVFAFCWLPRHIYLFWFNFDPSEYNLFWHIFKIIGFCLSFMNSCVNPLALYFLSKQFRKYYNDYLCCCCSCSPCCHRETASRGHYSNMYPSKDSTNMYSMRSVATHRTVVTVLNDKDSQTTI